MADPNETDIAWLTKGLPQPTPFSHKNVIHMLKKHQENSHSPVDTTFFEFTLPPEESEEIDYLDVTRPDTMSITEDEQRACPSASVEQTSRNRNLCNSCLSLVAWLFILGKTRCPVTNIPPLAMGLVQFTHILLPKKLKYEETALLWHEYLLGMKSYTLSIHSRLFLLPLSPNIRHTFNGNLLIFVPSSSLLQQIVVFLELVVILRKREKSQKEESQIAKQDMWCALRKGELKGEGEGECFESSNFADGTFHTYHVIFHPQLDTAGYQAVSQFESHVSPIAIVLNALTSLEEWRLGELTPLVPRSPFCPIPVTALVTLAEALTASGKTQKAEIDAIVVQFGEIDRILKELEALYLTDPGWGGLSTSETSKRGDDSRSDGKGDGSAGGEEMTDGAKGISSKHVGFNRSKLRFDGSYSDGGT